MLRRQPPHVVPSSAVITTAVPVRTRLPMAVPVRPRYPCGLPRLASARAIGVCSQRACHTRLGTPLYFAKIVFPKNAKSGKNRQKSAKSLKIGKIAKNDEKTRFLPLFPLAR